MTTPTRVLTQVEFAVLRPYAIGFTATDIAKTTGIEADRVNGIIVTKTSMNRHHAAELVRQHMAQKATPAPPAPASPPQPALATGGFVSPGQVYTLAEGETIDPTPTLDAILAAGEAHPLTRIRTLAVKVRAMFETLEATLLQAEQERKAAQAGALARAEAKARVKQLEQELAAARDAAGESKTRYGTNREAQRIRQWAADNGVPCGPNGRLPVAVQTRYRAALAAADTTKETNP